MCVTSCVMLTGGAVSAAGVPVPGTPTTLPAGIEAFQPYVGQNTCDPVAKPGVRAFSTLLLNTYTDTTSLGIVRDCGIGGQSEHKEGRAFDWGVSVTNAHQVAEVNAVLSWLLAPDAKGDKAARLRRLGIMYMIWNRQIWKSYQADKGWQAYVGESAHTDHVHFSFGWNGAKQVTSWWSGKVAPIDYGPSAPTTPDAPPPPRLPANLLIVSTYGATVLQRSSSLTPTALQVAGTKLVQAFLRLTADGDFGPDTTSGVRSFQSAQHLTVDGIVNADDWRTMFPRPQVPFGKLDTTAFGIPGTVSVSGWAEDADQTSPLQVHVYVDGVAVRALLAGGTRKDVEAAFPGVGSTLGYSTALALADGVHNVCAYAINVGAGSSNPAVGCRPVTVRHIPDGHADVLALAPGQVLSHGWAADPDSAAVVQVTQTVDGHTAATGAANLFRPDVAVLHPAYGEARGYATAIDLAAVIEGSHDFCAVATNLGPGTNRALGCLIATVRHTPFSGFDALTQTPDGLVARGWAIEPDATAPATVTATLDGRALASFTAALPRADLARAYPIYGADHGYATTFPTPTTAGSHTLCVTPVNTGAGVVPAPTCRTVLVRHNPVGNVDAVSVSAGHLSVRGWTLDPDSVGPLTVHLVVDGKVVTAGTADGTRSDLARPYPSYGTAHGFTISPTAVLATGTHKVCAYALNVGPGTQNPALACRTVTVP